MDKTVFLDDQTYEKLGMRAIPFCKHPPRLAHRAFFQQENGKLDERNIHFRTFARALSRIEPRIRATNRLVINLEQSRSVLRNMGLQKFTPSAVALLQYAKSLHPDCHISFYGIPGEWNASTKLADYTIRHTNRKRYHDVLKRLREWQLRSLRYRAIAAASSSLAVSCYLAYPRPDHEILSFLHQNISYFASWGIEINAYVRPVYTQQKEHDYIEGKRFRMVLDWLDSHPQVTSITIFRTSTDLKRGEWFNETMDFLRSR